MKKCLNILKNGLKMIYGYSLHTNFTLGTVSYYLSLSCCCCCCCLASSTASFFTMSSNLSRLYSIVSFILLYNKEAVSLTFVSCCCHWCWDSIMYLFDYILYPASHVYYIFLKSSPVLMYKRKWVREISPGHYFSL